MSDTHDNDNQDSAQSEGEGGGSARVNRRDALKKAAAAAGVAGAVWAAPKVEGLSIAPAYAAAATATPGNEVTITIGSSGSEKNVGSGCNPGGHQWAMTGLLSSPYAIRNHPTSAGGTLTHTNTPNVTVSGPTTSRGGVPGPTPKPTSWPSEPGSIHYSAGNPSAFTVSAPLGTGVGTVKVSTQLGYNDSDLDHENRFDVEFNVDPPFNKCRVTEAILYACLKEPNSENGNKYLNSYNADDGGRISNSNGSYAQRPVVTNGPGVNPTNQNNNVSTFTALVTTPDVYPGDAARALQFKISCV